MDKNIVKYIEDDVVTLSTERKLRKLNYPFETGVFCEISPTLSQVAKWLREKHHLFCQVKFDKNKFQDFSKNLCFAGKLIDMKTGYSKNVTNNSEGEWFESYAECLEYLIDRALRLLKCSEKPANGTNNWCENEII